MDRSELDIIKELMAELESKMEPGKDDFEERLGRKKPDIQMVKIEGDMKDPEEGLEDPKEESMESPEMERQEEMGEDPMHSSMHDMPMGDEMDPEARLKARLMKMRS